MLLGVFGIELWDVAFLMLLQIKLSHRMMRSVMKRSLQFIAQLYELISFWWPATLMLDLRSNDEIII